MGKKGFIRVNYIDMINVSGNISGAVCYIRNIGKYFPWFKYEIGSQNSICYLKDYNLETDATIWFLQIGFKKYDKWDWDTDGFFYFYKENPNEKINNKESILGKLKKPKKLNRKKKSIRKLLI